MADESLSVNFGCSLADLMEAAGRAERGRKSAASRIRRAATGHPDLDQEEVDHLNEIARLIEDGLPIAGILDFRPADNQQKDEVNG